MPGEGARQDFIRRRNVWTARECNPSNEGEVCEKIYLLTTLLPGRRTLAIPGSLLKGADISHMRRISGIKCPEYPFP